MNDNILTLQIEPLDTLFFRDGKPFSMGDDSWADGVFPPAPSVIYGAIRTWILGNNENVNLENIITETDDLEICELYYNIRGNNVLSLPLDYGTKKDKGKQIKFIEDKDKIVDVERFSITENKTITSVDSNYLIYNEHNYVLEKVENAFITILDFISYLKNEKEIEKIKCQILNTYTEPKIGIGRDNTTLSSDEGKLYRVGLERYKDFNFILRIEAKFISEDYSNILKLGGEGKIVIIKDFLKRSKIKKITTNVKTKNLLVYLATPAIFHNEIPNLKQYLGVEAKLIASSVGKAVNIGGFDMKERKPKIMYKAVPAGSVYFFQLEKEIEVDQFQGTKISDELNKQGFGIAYFGTFK